MIVRSQYGNDIVEFLPPDAALDPAIPLTFTVVVAAHQDRTVLIFNTDRNQWEAPGGGIEPGETIEDCAIREFMEEACQTAESVDLVGYGRMRFHTRGGAQEYCAMFTATVSELQPFTPSAECAQLLLWDGDESVLDGELGPWARAFIAHCQGRASSSQ